MLNAHPDIIAPPESGFMHWWHKKYAHWCFADSQNETLVKAYVQDVLSSRKMETWGLTEHVVIDVIDRYSPVNYAELSECVYLAKATMENRQVSHIVDKNNYYINHLHDLYAIWPDAKALFIIRDGRDVACSYRELKAVSDQTYKPRLPVDWLDIAAEWNTNNLNIYHFLSEHVPVNNWLMIRYEDLVNDPKAILKRVCECLQIDFHSRMLEYYHFNNEPGETIDWKKKTLEAPDISGIGRYRTHMSVADQLEFNKIAEEGLKLANYVY
jgi:hypothetical protein